jgi:hypothetical protein
VRPCATAGLMDEGAEHATSPRVAATMWGRDTAGEDRRKPRGQQAFALLEPMLESLELIDPLGELSFVLSGTAQWLVFIDRARCAVTCRACPPR